MNNDSNPAFVKECFVCGKPIRMNQSSVGGEDESLPGKRWRHSSCEPAPHDTARRYYMQTDDPSLLVDATDEVAALRAENELLEDLLAAQRRSVARAEAERDAMRAVVEAAEEDPFPTPALKEALDAYREGTRG